MTDELARELREKLAVGAAGMSSTPEVSSGAREFVSVLKELADKGRGLLDQGASSATRGLKSVADSAKSFARMPTVDPRLVALQDSARAQRAATLQAAQMDHWGRAGVGALGVGSVLAGLEASRRAARERKKKEYPTHINDLPIPYDVSKQADDTLSNIASSVGSTLGSSAGQALNASGRGLLSSVITPDDRVTSPVDLSTHPVGLGVAMLGGLFLGKKGIGAALAKVQKSRQDAEMEKKRNEFKRELLSLYGKTAGTLQRCYVATEKAADVGNKIRNLSLLAATLAAPYGFTTQYSHAKKHDDRAALMKAMKLRARLRESQQPADLYASLEPVARPALPG